MTIVEAKIGNAVDPAVEGGVPGAVGGNDDFLILILELIRGDVYGELIKLKPGMPVPAALADDEVRAAAIVDLEKFR